MIIQGIVIFYKNNTTCNISVKNILHIVKNKELKYIHGDTVTYDTETKLIKNVIKRTTLNIVGTLCLSNRTIMGLTKRKIPMRIFIPSDNIYPSFIVATKKKTQATDVYAIIKVSKWGNKYPIGDLVSILGNVTDIDVEMDYIRYKNNIRWKSYNNFNPTPYLADLTPNRETILENIISIDPIGCKDIDDAMHYKEFDKYIEVGVHIADPTSFIPHKSPLDIELLKRGESTYLDGAQFNLMPDIFAFDNCSLVEKKERRAFSAIFRIDKNTDKISVKFTKTIITVSKNLSYDKATKIIQSRKTHKIAIALKGLYNLGIKLAYIYNSTDFNPISYDCHKMIEIYMIMTNVHVAKYLINNSKCAPLRIQPISGKNIITDHNIPHNIFELSNLYKMQKASYCINADDTTHHSLQQKYYTHFTSPIRRYFDQIIHRLLYNTIYNKHVSDTLVNIINNDIQLQCNSLNIIHDQSKQAERDSNRVQLAHKLYNNNNLSFKTNGYIVCIRDNKLMINIPELEIDLEFKIFSHKLSQLITYVSNNNIITINMKDKELSLHLYQKVQIYVVVTIKEYNIYKKLQIQMINPNILDFLQIN